MVEEPTPDDCAANSPEEASAPPRDSVSGVTQPDTILNEKDRQEHQCHSRQEAEPTIPRPPERRWDGYGFWAIVLSALTLLVLVANAYLVVQGHELVRNDQRAWVGILRLQTPGKITEMVKEGLPITVNAVLQNFGKGPALQTGCAISMRIMRKEDEFVATYDQQGSPKAAQEISVPVSAAAVWPGITYATPPASLTPSDQEVAEIRAGTKILYFYGKATYNDAFGKPRWTHFCCRYTPDPPAWLAHSTYNEAK